MGRDEGGLVSSLVNFSLGLGLEDTVQCSRKEEGWFSVRGNEN